MTVELCDGMPPEYWSPHDEGARFALAICQRCPSRPTCLDGDPAPCGVIRAGVAYSDDGEPLPECQTCGYPHTSTKPRSLDRCPRCDVPSVSRWRSNVLRWQAEGVSTSESARRIGATTGQIRDLRRQRATAVAA